MTTRISAVILTRGDRPEEMGRAIASIGRQRDIEAEVVIVWNGAAFDQSLQTARAPAGPTVQHVTLHENVGIPEGRNVGAQHAASDLVFFLDDDAELLDEGALAGVARRFVADPSLGAVGLRIVDELRRTSQRHVPRLGSSGADRSGPVSSFLGGVVVLRRAAFEQVGGYAGEFFYAMEETDLAWRLMDAGWGIWYAADVTVFHPHSSPTRHPEAEWRTARNRVWLAHRSLPVPLAITYLVNWFLVTSLRSPRSWRTTLGGYRDGWRTRIGPRRPIRWRTVWRLTRLGRPPVL